ncbi:MAG: 50S ribosomal protein L19e [Methanofollis sp.]|jgi:large subunit ribosomal protein L19e|uniref:50S ribosomal protein L19e n=1 Tax=unclassified Methanofollis TaxID=2634179 RepID=UPI00261F1021|nr:50S ribosomal protein L19e [Methanofollis sp.]MDD4254760.1 50S ribosomal protein L19e [Methanofollis sp.]
MSDLSTQKRIAAAVLKCGVNRVWFDPARLTDIEGAISREEIRKLAEEGVVKAATVKGNSRGRVRARTANRSYGHQKGYGNRKGTAGARTPSKRQWIQRIRAIRSSLREMREDGTVDRHTYRRLYRRAAGGQFRSRAHLKTHVEMMKGRIE